MRLVRLGFALLVVLALGTLAQARGLEDPAKPRNLTAKADGPFAVELDWRRVGGAEYYYVYRDGNRVAAVEKSQYRDEGLEPATTYVYRVSAVDDDDDEGRLSDPVQVTTDPLPGPSPPEDLVATAIDPYGIDLEWSPSESSSAIVFYRVFRDGEEIAAIGDPAYEDRGLVPETTYEYRVSAVDDEDRESDRSEPASATTPAIPPPPPPGDVTAMARSSTQIDVSWSPPAWSETTITGYGVYRDGDLVSFVVAPGFVDSSLAPETTYAYAISSVDDRGLEGDRSQEVSATTGAPQDIIPPAPPTGLRLAGGGSGEGD